MHYFDRFPFLACILWVPIPPDLKVTFLDREMPKVGTHTGTVNKLPCLGVDRQF